MDKGLEQGMQPSCQVAGLEAGKLNLLVKKTGLDNCSQVARQGLWHGQGLGLEQGLGHEHGLSRDHGLGGHHGSLS